MKKKKNEANKHLRASEKVSNPKLGSQVLVKSKGYKAETQPSFPHNHPRMKNLTWDATCNDYIYGGRSKCPVIDHNQSDGRFD